MGVEQEARGGGSKQFLGGAIHQCFLGFKKFLNMQYTTVIGMIY